MAKHYSIPNSVIITKDASIPGLDAAGHTALTLAKWKHAKLMFAKSFHFARSPEPVYRDGAWHFTLIVVV